MKTAQSLRIKWLSVVATTVFSLHTQRIPTHAVGAFYKGVLITCVLWAAQGQRPPLQQEEGAIDHLQILDARWAETSEILAQPSFVQPNKYWDKVMRDTLKKPANPSTRLEKALDAAKTYPASRQLLQANKNTKGPCDDKKEDAYRAGVLAGIGTIGGIIACCVGSIIGWQQGVIHGYLPSPRRKNSKK